MNARICAIAVLAFIGCFLTEVAAQNDRKPDRVTFQSADGKTTLVGYLYRPEPGNGTRAPAVVMMHGRAGAYSSLANGVYDASTLSKRHKMWGAFLAEHGYFALMVDGFGPRGYPQGFPAHSYADRPAELSEVTVRPLDAYGAAAYLRTLDGIEGSRLGLLGWSNGGSTVLAAMDAGAPGLPATASEAGFRAAVAFYPGCGLKGEFKEKDYNPYAPVRVFHGLSDEETSPRVCQEFVDTARDKGANIAITLYDGATHDFDSPDSRRRRVEANAAATEDAMRKALGFFDARLK